MGVIDSLSAGYRFLGRRIELVLIPILLDLLLWLGPQFSVAPLFEQVGRFYRTAAGASELPPDAATMAEQVSELLLLTGERSNLMGLLVNSSLLHVPSLIAAISPLGTQAAMQISDWGLAIGLFIGLGLAGLFIGVLYLNVMALHLPIGSGPKPANLREFLQAALRHWLMIVLYIVLMACLLLIGALPVSIGVGLLTFISPAVGSFAMMAFSGIIIMIFFYLYFVSAALVMDNLPVHRAMGQSFRLVRNNFWATLGFVILTNIIAIGITLVMDRLTELQPIGVVAAVGIHAYVGSGLTMALLVFYRTRILRAAGEQIDLEEATG